jgi:hypothetical protein
MKWAIFILSVIPAAMLMLLPQPAAATTIQFRLVMNNTAATFYVPGSGEYVFSSLPAQAYTSPEHFYLASYLGDVLIANVYYYQSPASVFVEKTANTYTLGTNMNLSNSIALLVFTQGNSWRVIDNRMELIGKGRFMEELLPSFSFGLGEKQSIGAMVGFSSIDITSKGMILEPGYYRLMVENKGEAGGKDLVAITKA